jgi:F0F1-type ATP synthase assembly protein I|tara:strand:- start:135 stop:359 length:225 start_codon:yes stop_codon:yes gene_type:complete
LKQSDFAKHATLGIEFFASIALFTWIGYKLDIVAGFSDGFPLFLLLGVFLGLGLGIYRLYLKMNDDDSRPPSSE